MNFEYEDYYTHLYEMPLFTIGFSIFFIIVPIILLFFAYRKKNKIDKKLIGYVVIIIFSIFLLVSGINDLELSIKKDSNQQTIATSGVIELIEDIKNPPRFIYEGEVVRSKIVTISGIEYYIMTVGEFDIDDFVTIEYLPNSKVIMLIEHSEE